MKTKIETILNDYPNSQIVKETDNGILVQTDFNEKSYLVFPTCFIDGYDSFRENKAHEFRSFMYCLGALCRELNEKAQDGYYRADLCPAQISDLYCAKIDFVSEKKEETEKSSNMTIPEKAKLSICYLLRYKGFENVYA